MSYQHKRYLTLCGIGLHSILPRDLADGLITPTGEFYDLPQIRYNVRRGRIETAQVYQFDHIGQGPTETLV